MRRISPSSDALQVYVSLLRLLRRPSADPTDQHENATIIGLTPKLIPIFASVLDDPMEQLQIDTRAKIVATVKFIHEKNPSLISGNETLMNCVRG